MSGGVYDGFYSEPLRLWTCTACQTFWARGSRWYGGERVPHVRIDLDPGKQIECVNNAYLCIDPVLVSAFMLGGLQAVLPLVQLTHTYDDNFDALVRLDPIRFDAP